MTINNIEHIVNNTVFRENCIVINEFSEDTIYYNNPKNIHTFLEFLRDCKTPFQMLIDVCGVHYPMNEKPFEVVYHLLSLTHNLRLRVIVRLNDGESIHTVDSVYNSACWFERETYDMYGIIFTNSKDLRRILTDYNFQDFPLRKDFPLSGKEEIRYDPIAGEIVYEPSVLVQDYRDFDFKSNWK